ncbi:MAG: 3-deoxy-8-phosphooctulonate synthase [Candidatus Omnitrophica bacterium]|nr:3-deoxy-8-phosphooctulonate synthase [Candidatus Omnitrophota bacterium]
MTKQIKIKNIKVGKGAPLVLIAGPCVIEDAKTCLETAEAILDITKKLKVPFIFKASFDKANRTSGSSYRGPGLAKGLKILQTIKEKFKVPVLSDIHSPEQAKKAAKVLDVIQIPAFLCRQTDLIIAAAKTGRVINIKKGQFLAPWDVQQIIKKIEKTGNRKILITERGSSFGYNNLVSDFRSIVILRKFGYPVIYDATHSVQLPGGKGICSSGQREFVAYLSRAAAAVGCDALFLEVHPNPKKALSDGPNMITPSELKKILIQVTGIDRLLQAFRIKS